MKKNEAKKMSEVIAEAAGNKENVVLAALPKPSENKKEKKESILSEAEKRQQEIERKTRELQKCLEALENKKQLSNHRKAFLQALDNLADAETKLNEEDAFDSKLYKLRFADSSAYNNNDIFSITNNLIIVEFVNFMQEKIKNKIAEIELQLIEE